MFNCFPNYKSVTFDNKVLVYLIPSRNDLRNDYLINLLWWTEEDYEIFKNNLKKEMDILKKYHLIKLR
jgi:hypothetical protein